MAGLLYYVFIYTRWLKRTSPQNIVIGGAAGAFPPLVGWAAATGEVSLTAVYLFMIVFFWTPPHFWALALVKQKDYGRVGVPMAPNVWGERETMRQMLIYTLILVPLSLGPVTYGGLGPIYGVLATGAGPVVPARRGALMRAGGLRAAGVDAVPQLAAVPGAALRRHGGGRRGGARGGGVAGRDLRAATHVASAAAGR